jgi:NodT family efflux transporter outer membrane factor (OMF) lipoprotein
MDRQIEMRNRQPILIALLAVNLLTGCTGPIQYLRNRFKVGPEYGRPPAPIAEKWIDEDDHRVKREGENNHFADWWAEFNDPVLERLIALSYRENLTLREAGFRVLAARAQFGIAAGYFFPQLQNATGAYTRFGIADSFFDQWNFGFNLVWELDFWGRFRRAIRLADATLDASVENYDAVLVTLLGDVASNYVRYRTIEERIRLLENIVAIQEDVLEFINQKLELGAKFVTEVDRAQAGSNLAQSRAQLDDLEIQLRQTQNLLCTLLGMPVSDLAALLDGGPRSTIPMAPDYVVVGIPADLLRRRPDVRRAERQAAAQAEMIGIAESQFYPAISISGTLGWQATEFSDLFKSQSLSSFAGPSFRWNLLNYGRILNDVRYQDAQFQALVATYQNSVLRADLEVENAIVAFLKSQERAKNLQESVDQAALALQVVIEQYESGLASADFNRYAVIQQTLIQQQDLWAQSRGQIALGLIDVYRALGGGWQIRLQSPSNISPIASSSLPEELPPNANDVSTRLRSEPLPSPPLVPLPPLR